MPSIPRSQWIRSLLKSLGPGIITGAADDDPSGIATYSVAGAQFGTSLLWIALITWPLMSAVQMMCVRIGEVTGQGLAENFKQRFPKGLLLAFVIALLVANTINIGADLAGMADAVAMLSGINAHWFVIAFAIAISWATVRLHYDQIASVLKWLVLVLFAYPITAFVVGANWGEVLHTTLIPSMPRSREEWAMLVAILGTTISPYLFFWQASEEVEEEKLAGRSTLTQRRGATPQELALRNIDVGVGAFFSNMVMFFIILTTAMGLDFIGINPVKALYWTAVINGLLAPFLLVAILIVAADKKLMRGQPSSRLGWMIVATATVARHLFRITLAIMWRQK